MGVSGVGKSTIGQLLADEMNLPFFDGDNYHSKENVEKMSSGESLNDDRHSWLLTLNQLAKEQLKNNSCILVCSALKNKYRELLSDGIQNEIKWIHLFGDFDTIYNRINKRKHHFMPSELLKSQFDILKNLQML